jgi:hypothetical protein
MAPGEAGLVFALGIIDPPSIAGRAAYAALGSRAKPRHLRSDAVPARAALGGEYCPPCDGPLFRPALGLLPLALTQGVMRMRAKHDGTPRPALWVLFPICRPRSAFASPLATLTQELGAPRTRLGV